MSSRGHGERADHHAGAKRHTRAGGSALLGSVVPSSSSLSSGALSAYSFEETDEWFNEQKIYLDSLENALKGMVKSVSALSNQRKQIVQATHDLGQVLTTLSGSSLSRSLSTCFAGLAEVQKRAMELEDLQAEADVRQLGTTMYEYERVVGSVRKAFKVRTEVWAKSARQADELRKARARFDKYKAANPSSAGPQFQSLLAEVTEAETKALDAQRLFDTVSSRCKEEMERLDLERVLDFKRVVGEWLGDMIRRQEEVVEEWVEYARLLGRQTGVKILPEERAEEEQQPSPQPELSRSQSQAANGGDGGSTVSTAVHGGEAIGAGVGEGAKQQSGGDAKAQESTPVQVGDPKETEDAPAIEAMPTKAISSADSVDAEAPSKAAVEEASVPAVCGDSKVDDDAAPVEATQAGASEVAGAAPSSDTGGSRVEEDSAEARVDSTTDAKVADGEVDRSSQTAQ